MRSALWGVDVWKWTHWLGGVWTDNDVVVEVEGELKMSKGVSAENDGIPTKHGKHSDVNHWAVAIATNFWE
jgi:hypothetical protein